MLGWSGGKDSSLALRKIIAEGRYEVASLLTTCTEGFRRVSMHGVRCSLLNHQAEAIRLPCPEHRHVVWTCRHYHVVCRLH